MTTTELLQGFGLLLPVILFTVLAFWTLHPAIFLFAAGIALMTGLYIPDILTGDTSNGMTLSIGMLLVVYAFACIAFSYITMFRSLRKGE